MSTHAFVANGLYDMLVIVMVKYRATYHILADEQTNTVALYCRIIPAIKIVCVYLASTPCALKDVQIELLYTARSLPSWAFLTQQEEHHRHLQSRTSTVKIRTSKR